MFVDKALKVGGFSSEVRNMILTASPRWNMRLWLMGVFPKKWFLLEVLKRGTHFTPTCWSSVSKISLGCLLRILRFKRLRPVLAISHLLYADDMLITYCANLQNAPAIVNSLNIYCSRSGQLNNWKSNVLFSSNLCKSLKRNIKYLLGLKEVRRDAIYLGNNLLFGRNKTKNFGD